MTRPRSGWPSPVNLDPARGGWPAALMPGRKQGWPRGVNTSADPAENLLSTAVGWWDAAWYTPGDRFLRNRGVAGELLDMRLGSSLAANSNDPLFLAPEATGYCYLPGVAANYLSVPSAAALDITGDIDVRVLCSLDDWTPAAITNLAAKDSSGGVARSWTWTVNTNGTLQLAWWDSGGTLRIASSTAAPTIADGAPLWVRVTLDVDNGAGTPQYEVKFWTSPASDGVNWTQLGNTVTGAVGVTSIRVSATVTEIGSYATGAARNLSGRMYRAQVFASIDGTDLRLDVNCDVLKSDSATSFTEQSSNAATVTINKSTGGRKTKAVPAAGRGGTRQFLLGTDDFFEIPAENVWQHQLLNFPAGQDFTVFAVGRTFATSTNEAMLAKKNNFVTDDLGWVVGRSATSTRGRVYSTTAYASGNVDAAGTYGGITLSAMTLAGPTLRVYNNTTATTASTRAFGSFTNTLTTRIGSTPNTFYNGELTAAAVFRRALTADELATVTTYYTGRNF